MSLWTNCPQIKMTVQKFKIVHCPGSNYTLFRCGWKTCPMPRSTHMLSNSTPSTLASYLELKLGPEHVRIHAEDDLLAQIPAAHQSEHSPERVV